MTGWERSLHGVTAYALAQLTAVQREDYEHDRTVYLRAGFQAADACEAAYAGVTGDRSTVDRLRAAYVSHARL